MEETIRVILPYNKHHGRVKGDCPSGCEEYNGDWFMSTFGDLYNAWVDYSIPHTRLGEDDWILHLMNKDWFDANTFLPAYMEACRRCGGVVVQMRLRY